MKKTKSSSHNILDPKLDYQLILNQMIEWARDCGYILRKHLFLSYKKPMKILNKGDEGLATEADLLSEKYVMDKINEHYPGHTILSEEDCFVRKIDFQDVSASQCLWLIDPLDGTNNFYHRIPFFSVSLAFARGSSSVVGVVYNPINEDLFYAIRGRGANLIRHLGDEKVHIPIKVDKSRVNFKEALLSANSLELISKDKSETSFTKTKGKRRLGSAALEMSYVAAGMLDGYWEEGLKPWDMAAAGLICEEAGVKISTTAGDRYDFFTSSVLVAHPSLYEEILKNLNQK